MLLIDRTYQTGNEHCAVSDNSIKRGNNTFMSNFVKTDDIVKDLRDIIEHSRETAYKAVNTALVQRNGLIGYRIAEEEMQGENRAEYGSRVIKRLSEELTSIYGKGFTKSSLYSCYSFYKAYPQIFQAASGKSDIRLLWSHYTVLLQVEDTAARDWYEKEAAEVSMKLQNILRYF